MAVAKMKKLTLIADKKQQDAILTALQSLQQVQLRDVFTGNSANAWVKRYFAAVLPRDTSQIEQLQQQRLKELRDALQFIKHNGATQQKDSTLKRRIVSLTELEAAYDEAALMQELAEIQTLKSSWQQLLAQKKQLEEEEAYLTAWQYLDVIPAAYRSHQTILLVGSVASENWAAFSAELQKLGAYLEAVYEGTKETRFASVYLQQQAASAAELRQQFNVSEAVLPETESAAKRLKAVKEHWQHTTKKLQQITAKIGHKRLVIEQLQWAEEVILAQQQREQAKQLFVASDHLMVLQGWVAKKDYPLVQAALSESVSLEELYLTVSDPTKEEIAEEIPTKLENHTVVAPFEILTEMYSLPRYEEIDPTPWFMPFFMVFFGMMVADAGYGLLMLAVTTIALKKAVLPRGLARFMRFFRLLSVPVIAWGLIYASFFGLTLPYPPLLSTSEDVITILLLSVIFGLIQIMTGLGLAASENIKRRDYLQAVADGFAWQGLLLGIGLAACGKVLLNSQGLFICGLLLAGISALAIVVIPILNSSSKLKGAAKGAYNLYGLANYVGDLVSYTRLMALGISGGSIAAAFNLLVAFMPPAARFTVGLLLIAALHALNIFLSLLGAYVHGARLQYVEFFGKFYTGGGRSFAPLKTKEKYLTIENKKTTGGK